MDNTSFAFLDEVWSPEKNCQPIAQDDIMSAFIDNNEKKCYPPNDLKSSKDTQFILPSGNPELIEGYDNNDFYIFDDYFVNDIQSMKDNKDDEHKKQIEQEELIENEKSYDVIEDYSPKNVPEIPNVVTSILTDTGSKPFITSEIIIIVLCGIILMLLFDKFVSLSIRLRK